MKIKRKPVKHLADCDDCFAPSADGMRIRDKSICQNCTAYKQCIASQTDRAARGAMRRINKMFR